VIRVNMLEAKTNLSKLVAAAERGETVEICRNGKPVVQMTPSPNAFAAKRARTLGGMEGLIIIHDPTWDAPMTDEEFFGSTPDILDEWIAGRTKAREGA
jgi:prevent-host-death family protein